MLASTTKGPPERSTWRLRRSLKEKKLRRPVFPMRDKICAATRSSVGSFESNEMQGKSARFSRCRRVVVIMILAAIELDVFGLSDK
jgi:hypothetical protein